MNIPGIARLSELQRDLVQYGTPIDGEIVRFIETCRIYEDAVRECRQSDSPMSHDGFQMQELVISLYERANKVLPIVGYDLPIDTAIFSDVDINDE